MTPLERLGEVDSTNLEARRRGEAQAELAPVWLRADRQTAGRGRRGRSWISTEGALLATYLGRTDAPLNHVALTGFAAGLAVAEALAAFGQPQALLKWPNDIFLEGAKIGGVLAESSASPGGGLWFAVGIGLNLAAAPADAGQATAAAFPPGQAPSPDAFLERMRPLFAHWCARLDMEGFAGLRAAWLARAYGVGGPVRTVVDGVERTGVFRTVDKSGALVLDLAGQAQRITAGDVFFPAQSDSVP